MPTRADLLKTAEALAENARHHADATNWQRATEMAQAAKTALEAAALAEDVGGDEITEALDAIQDLLADAGVLDEAMELGPVEFLDRTFRALLAWRKEALSAQGYVVAYETLSALSDSLLRDFTNADTATAHRIATRIQSAVDEAKAIIERNGRVSGGETEG